MLRHLRTAMRCHSWADRALSHYVLGVGAGECPAAQAGQGQARWCTYLLERGRKRAGRPPRRFLTGLRAQDGTWCSAQFCPPACTALAWRTSSLLRPPALARPL